MTDRTFSQPEIQPIDLRSDWTPSSNHRSITALREALFQAYGDMRDGPVAPEWDPKRAAEEVAAIDLAEPIGLAGATREVSELMRRGDLLSSSARCFGYFNPTSAWPGVIADILAAARNPQMCVRSHAPASVAMERGTIAFLQRLLGFPPDATGNFCSGGSEANGTALLVALVMADSNFETQGVAAFSGRPCFYVSSDSHMAWIKIARAAGLGSRAVRLVPAAGDGRMDVRALGNGYGTTRSRAGEVS